MKSKLYFGDSSDDEELKYDASRIMNNCSNLSWIEPKLISSFILEEIGQSILENKKIVDSYHEKLSEISAVCSPSINLNLNITTKFIFGSHLLDLKQNTNENTELQNFYKENLEKIQEFNKNISIIEDIYSWYTKSY